MAFSVDSVIERTFCDVLKMRTVVCLTAGSICYSFEFYVEMACNGMFGLGDGSMISPPSTNRYFDVSIVEIAVLNQDCHQLILDLTILLGMAEVSTLAYS